MGIDEVLDECEIEDCENRALMTLQLEESGFLEGELELCRKHGNFYFDKAAKKSEHKMK